MQRLLSRPSIGPFFSACVLYWQLAPLNYHNPDSLRPEAGAGWGAHGGGHAQPMGVGSKAAADARLAALKAELAKEVRVWWCTAAAFHSLLSLLSMAGTAMPTQLVWSLGACNMPCLSTTAWPGINWACCFRSVGMSCDMHIAAPIRPLGKPVKPMPGSLERTPERKKQTVGRLLGLVHWLNPVVLLAGAVARVPCCAGPAAFCP